MAWCGFFRAAKGGEQLRRGIWDTSNRHGNFIFACSSILCVGDALCFGGRTLDVAAFTSNVLRWIQLGFPEL